MRIKWLKNRFIYSWFSFVTIFMICGITMFNTEQMKAASKPYAYFFHFPKTYISTGSWQTLTLYSTSDAIASLTYVPTGNYILKSSFAYDGESTTIPTGYKECWKVYITSNSSNIYTAYPGVTKFSDLYSYFNTSSSDDIKFDLGAEAITYKITYNSNGGTGSMSSSTHVYDTAKTLTANTYTRTGYTFNGWNTKADGTGTSYANKASVKNLTTTDGTTITLYAQWKVNSYNLTVNPNGGTYNGSSSATKSTVTYGKATSIANPQRTGYQFLGWKITGTSPTKINELANGYNNYNSVLQSGKLTVTNSSDGTYTNYKYSGITATSDAWNWIRFPDYSVSAGDTVTISGYIRINSSPVNLNILHSAYNNDYNNKIRIIKTSEIGDWIYFEGTRTFTSASTTAKIEITTSSLKNVTDTIDFDVKGLKIVKNGTDISMTTLLPGAGDTTLLAQWEHNEYTVTYDANGGTTTATKQTVYYGDAIDLSPVAESEGKIFVGWSTDPNATKPVSSITMPDLATSSNKDYSSDWELTLYAIYSIPVSDVSNHKYPDYEAINEDEVYLLVWENGNTANYRTYQLTYTSDVNTMVYKYTLPTTDISSFVSGMEKYCYQIIAYDNAGNYGILLEGTSSNSNEKPEDFPIAEKYLQTVNHYKYDIAIEEWVKFDTTTELVEEGTTFRPTYTILPEGYQTSSIDTAYIVSKEQTSSAYYEPIKYTLTYHTNGGTCSTSKKVISYGEFYGNMPTPSRTGYTFLGWYTAKTGGTQVRSSDKYVTAGDTTIYAHWTINSYSVTYDYWTNGGTSVTLEENFYDYGSTVDLSVAASKSGAGLSDWSFIGWNTDPDATTGLSSFSISNKDEVLYAIYEKDIVVTIIERNDTTTVSRNLSKTIYNNETDAEFTIKKINSWIGWTLLGWTTERGAEELPIVGINSKYRASDNITLYGSYTSEITVSYDTNGSSMEFDSQTKDCFYNASGDSYYPSFTIADEPILSNHSFVEWKAENGNHYKAGGNVIFKENTVLTAIWDEYPEIEAYDRYFTLEEAKNGDITEDKLLEKVSATDHEDGVLFNGIDVIVKAYNAFDFTSVETNREIEVTYQATDSYGNIVTKTVTICVVDTTTQKGSKKSYVRFISSQFFTDDEGNLVSSAMGGLEESSIWRKNSSYFNLLKIVLSNSNSDRDIWHFKQEDIQEIKEYTNVYGPVSNAVDKFFELFDRIKN